MVGSIIEGGGEKKKWLDRRVLVQALQTPAWLLERTLEGGGQNHKNHTITEDSADEPTIAQTTKGRHRMIDFSPYGLGGEEK